MKHLAEETLPAETWQPARGAVKSDSRPSVVGRAAPERAQW